MGALYVRRKNPRVELTPMIDGGGHEHGMRSGTLNVPGIVGLGKACELCREEMDAESVRLWMLRDRLKAKIFAGLDDVYVNGSMEHRLPGNLNLSFANVEAEPLLMGINDVAVSTGSACSSAAIEPSHVLKALGAARPHPRLHPLRHRALQHPGGNRLRRSPCGGNGEAPARALADVRGRTRNN